MLFVERAAIEIKTLSRKGEGFLSCDDDAGYFTPYFYRHLTKQFKDSFPSLLVGEGGVQRMTDEGEPESIFENEESPHPICFAGYPSRLGRILINHNCAIFAIEEPMGTNLEGASPHIAAVQCGDADRRSMEVGHLLLGQRFPYPTVREAERQGRVSLFFSKWLESDAPVEGRVAVCDSNLDAFRAQHLKRPGEQGLSDALPLALGGNGHWRQQEYDMRVFRVSQAREDCCTNGIACYLCAKHPDVLRWRFCEQTPHQVANQRTFLRPLRGSEGSSKEFNECFLASYKAGGDVQGRPPFPSGAYCLRETSATNVSVEEVVSHRGQIRAKQSLSIVRLCLYLERYGGQCDRMLINSRQFGQEAIQTPQRSLPWLKDVMT